MSDPAAPTRPEAPARRYPRTFGGLIASLIVLVLVMLVYWAVQTWMHKDSSDAPVAVDYVHGVVDVQQAMSEAGVTPWIVYPATLPSGWTATSAQYTPGNADEEQWRLGFVTDHDTFVGVVQQKSLSDAASTFLNGGKNDHGENVTVQGHDVYVYGDADAADTQLLVSSLTSDVIFSRAPSSQS